MSYLIYNNQRVINPLGKYLTGVPVISGPMDFAGTNYVLLDPSTGAIDLSGDKIVTWKMYIQSDTFLHFFHLGSDGQNMYAKIDGSDIIAGNFNGSGAGASGSLIKGSKLYGHILECTAVKSSSALEWLSIGGYYADNMSRGESGTPAQNYSRIGSNGVPGPTGLRNLNNGWVWDVQVNGIGAWNGYGTKSNQNSAWVDTIGTNDGSIIGTPDIKVLSLPTPSYDDWYMPSKDELNAMYVNLHSVSSSYGFSENIAYWSSSETSSTTVWGQSFSTGGQISTIAKTNNFLNRPVRSFTDSVGAYSLRDVGPAGGWIFYIDGTTYYEAAPEDNVPEGLGSNTGAKWSNITGTASGATGTGFGAGASNTSTIIGQTGHLYSVAKLCDLYLIQ